MMGRTDGRPPHPPAAAAGAARTPGPPGRVRRSATRAGDFGRAVGDRRRRSGDVRARARRPGGAARGHRVRGAAPPRPPRHLRRDVRPVVSRRRWAPRRCCSTTTTPTRRTRGLPPEDIEAMRAALVDMLTENADLANLDERMAAMIAQIVEAYGRYNSSRGPSYSSYQALKAMSLDDLEGRLLAGLLAPYGDEPTPTQERDRQSSCRPTHRAAAQDGRGGDQASHRRATGPRPRPDVRRPAAGRERRVPARLRRAAAPDAPGGGAAGPHAGDPAGRAAATVTRR